MQGEGFIYILHRIIGQTVDVQGVVERGGFEMDNEANCRFSFVLEMRKGKWDVAFYTLLFDKDKIVPVNPGREYVIPKEEASKYPSGYRYMA
ncbi:hypothetical protein LTR35_010184 [Friedmanniomyces endolithicus]|uniref:Uncharacterized protein n=1 Tax=Friedmanniomyces endolithicus TaxID=329885 RepID=A0AAN6J2Q5_9PEZI|nr:hypothetical protein LTR35_010184 [Friedmanniomyces endolithicus]KAK0282668.1 hypothetical protein LTS00_011970 [Friedmanniomyces endolithicus]KAK0311558.1 hypothetical protein LTR82_014260 [Friedmanniomyces endolithicus]KAK0987488.1 hypothetical protein LTR54_013080 [Friedmanniomyces endolithicus]